MLKARHWIAAGGLAFGAAYSFYIDNTPLVIFFSVLFVVVLIEPRLLSRISEVSIGSFRATFKRRIEKLKDLSPTEKDDIKRRVDQARSIEEIVDAVVGMIEEISKAKPRSD